jgi:uncharacterized membrane protein YfcA
MPEGLNEWAFAPLISLAGLIGSVVGGVGLITVPTLTMCLQPHSLNAMNTLGQLQKAKPSNSKSSVLLELEVLHPSPA